MEHSFDLQIAAKVGTNAAVIYKHICFWVEKNRANGKHFHDGRYWTYNSIKAFNEIFWYMGEKQVRNALHKLEKEGLILVGNYNEDRRDRTSWYTLADAVEPLEENDKETEGKGAFVPNGILHSAKGHMQITKRANDIYSLNTIDLYTDNKQQIINTPLTPQGDVPERANGGRPRAQPGTPSQEQLEHDFAIIYGIYPKKVGRTNAFLNYRQWVSAKGREVAGRRWRLTNRQIYLAVKNYVDQQVDKGTELKYYKGFDTLMGRQLLDFLVE